VCEHLLGRRYSYGDSDCIHLVIDALTAMGMNPPAVQQAWYTMTPRQVLRELAHYCNRVDLPAYDGDITVLAASPLAFGVTWQTGILYINQQMQAVDWKPAHALTIRRSYRMKSR
jgi:hypothetical protein